MIDETRAIYSIAQQVKKQLESLERLISNSGFPISMEWKFKDEKKLTELDESFIEQFLKNY